MSMINFHGTEDSRLISVTWRIAGMTVTDPVTLREYVGLVALEKFLRKPEAKEKKA